MQQATSLARRAALPDQANTSPHMVLVIESLRDRRCPVSYVGLPSPDGGTARLLLGPFDEAAVARSAIPAVRDMLDDSRERSALDVVHVQVDGRRIPTGELNHAVLVAWTTRDATLRGALAGERAA